MHKATDIVLFPQFGHRRCKSLERKKEKKEKKSGGLKDYDT